MQHNFGLEITEIKEEESHDGYNGFREVVHGELLPGAARWDIFRHEEELSESINPCMDRHKTDQMKDL